MMTTDLVEAASRLGIQHRDRLEQWDSFRTEYSGQLSRLATAAWAGRGHAPTAQAKLTSVSVRSLHRPPKTTRITGSIADDFRAFTVRFSDTPPGLPLVGLKDMIAVRGRTSSCGTRAFMGPVAESDASVVSSIRAAGFGISGFLNMHALAYGATGLSSEPVPVLNALDTRRVPGGSSSGSGVAVAARIVDYSVGTDTGGSVRIPAAANGVVGFKPTWGRVPTQGVVPLAPTLDHVGPIADSVAGVTQLFTAMDPETEPFNGLEVCPDLELTIGVPHDYFLDELDEPTRTAFEQAVAKLSNHPRISTVPIDLSDSSLTSAAQLGIMAPEALTSHLDLLRTHPYQLPPDVRLRLELGLLVTDQAYRRSMEFRTHWQNEVESAMRDVDILLTPTLPCLPPRIDSATVQLTSIETPIQKAVTRLTAPFNLSGHPAISLPFKMAPESFPIGLQLIGPFGHDLRLLAVAERIENLIE